MFIPTASSFIIAAPLYPGATDQPDLIPGRWVAIGLAFSAACVAALLADAGMAIDPFAGGTLAFTGIGAVLIAICYVLRTPANAAQRVGRDLAETVGLFMTVALLGATASYPLAAATHGSVDPWLQHIDDALHFDWVALYRLVGAHRSLQILGTAAYQSIFLIHALILGYCAWADRKAEARAFIATFWVAAIVTLALFRFLPATGPLATLWHGPLPYLPQSALFEADLFPPLRAHLVRDVDLVALRGLVSVPSFHTASGVVYIAAAWPLRRLRWPVVTLTGAMLLATPIEGTHYLADMLAGAAVALVAILSIGTLRRRLVSQTLR